jgi:hypothetical protein
VGKKMKDQIKSNKNYEILDGDDDVLLLGKAAFTVRQFKEIASRKFSDIMLNNKQTVRKWTPQESPPVKSIIDWMQSLPINEETTIPAGDINWNSPQEGIDCQILKIGSKGWQKGKLKIEVNRSFHSGQTQTSIKFCHEEPPEQKSPLDDLRQSEEYKKLSNNN